MSQTPVSATNTIAPTEESKARSEQSHSNMDEINAPAPPYDPNTPDPSFPFQSTDIEEGGFTNEYRTVSRTGLIPAANALQPIPSHTEVPPAALRDPEKARQLKDVRLVTWTPNDPENPLNYARWFKWCKHRLPKCFPCQMLIDVFKTLHLCVPCLSWK